MPSEEWKIKNFKQKWFAGETISVGIGQGAVAITPVQLLRAISAISMGGRMVVPHVVNPDRAPPGIVKLRSTPKSKMFRSIPTAGIHHRRDVSRAAARRHGSLGAHSRHRHRGQDGISADRFARHPRQAQKQRRLAQNGWFVGFTPRRNPDIVVCVFFQGGEHGRLAARIATQVIKAYVEKQQRTPTKMGRNRRATERGNRRSVDRSRSRGRQGHCKADVSTRSAKKPWQCDSSTQECIRDCAR